MINFAKITREGSDNPDYLINHQNFGEVRTTEFAKGVITEWEIIQEDPLQVRRCKVLCNDKESDYLPIFFRPKEGYWDDPVNGVKALDFDEDQKDYKMAWTSFRGGDEVIVILQEGDPVAVIGHYDGKPRIGEAVIKIVDTTGNLDDSPVKILPLFYTDECDECYVVEAEDNDFIGFDGLDLKLEKNENIIEDDYDFVETTIQSESNSFACFDETSEINVIHSMKFVLHYITIGPILYLFLFSFTKGEASYSYLATGARCNCAEGYTSIEESKTIEPKSIGISIFAGIYSDDTLKEIINAISSYKADAWNSMKQYTDNYQEEWEELCFSTPLYGGVGAIKFDIPGFYYQRELTKKIRSTLIDFTFMPLIQSYCTVHSEGYKSIINGECANWESTTTEEPGIFSFPDWSFDLTEFIELYVRSHEPDKLSDI